MSSGLHPPHFFFVIPPAYFSFFQDSCFDARRHLEEVMNPYILNVSMATRFCSEALCQGRGRCVRKHWNADVFLHLHPDRYQIRRRHRGGELVIDGSLSYDDVNWFDRHFDCMCYDDKGPCRHLDAPNTIQEAAVTAQNAAIRRPRPLLLLPLLSCLGLLLR